MEFSKHKLRQTHIQLMDHTMHPENLELEMLMEMDKLTMMTEHKSVILIQTSFTELT